jgi:hypothetical protein
VLPDDVLGRPRRADVGRPPLRMDVGRARFQRRSRSSNRRPACGRRADDRGGCAEGDKRRGGATVAAGWLEDESYRARGLELLPALFDDDDPAVRRTSSVVLGRPVLGLPRRTQSHQGICPKPRAP